MKKTAVQRYREEDTFHTLTDSFVAMIESQEDHNDNDIRQAVILASLIHTKKERSKLLPFGDLEGLFQKEKKLEALLEI